MPADESAKHSLQLDTVNSAEIRLEQCNRWGCAHLAFGEFCGRHAVEKEATI